jgi:hypothetical protein
LILLHRVGTTMRYEFFYMGEFSNELSEMTMENTLKNILDTKGRECLANIAEKKREQAAAWKLEHEEIQRIKEERFRAALELKARIAALPRIPCPRCSDLVPNDGQELECMCGATWMHGDTVYQIADEILVNGKVKFSIHKIVSRKNKLGRKAWKRLE